MTSKIIPVIMAGGNGTRLWPLSRSQYPKQFLKLNNDYSLLQNTINRLSDLDCLDPILICNEEHRFIVAEQLREIRKKGKIILEPVGKNTAPAITLAALKAMENISSNDIDDTVLIVLSADHYIEDESLFLKSVTNAVNLAKENHLVTFGIVPNKAETGYGYIKKGRQLSSHGFEVDKFIEKPNKQLAEIYVQDSAFLWNSGMFVFRASVFLQEMATYANDILTTCIHALKESNNDADFIRMKSGVFESCRSESIDYAVMEKTKKAVVVILESVWSDIGSWTALWEIQKKNEFNNVIQGDVIGIDSINNYIYADNRLVATVGVRDLIIIETKDAILISHKENVQDVKKVVDSIKRQQRSEHLTHREVYRPWGKYDSIDSSKRYQVKRITVKPGEKLSVQMHHHRSEHWIIVSGTAKVYKGKEEILLTENQSIYIPVGEIHALENPGRIPLELIEVQSGAYLGEDDIVRFQDRYGRN